MTPLFSHIELTEEEKEYALLDFKATKYFEMLDKAKVDEKEQKRIKALTPWTFQEQKNFSYKVSLDLAARSNKELVIDEEYKRVFNLLCQYFTNDKAFEEENENFSLKKGILLLGNPGVGKTDLMLAFAKNKKLCYEMKSAKEIREEVKSLGQEFWKAYCGFVPVSSSREEYFYKPGAGWLIDDFGQEEVVNDFGNKLDCISNIISFRYENRDKMPLFALHMTSNLNAEMIEARYGGPFRSRLRDMFNIIKYNGVDRRK
jgi:DNA replication protein DnaC